MDFSVLSDLVKTITKNKVKNIEVLGNPGPDGNLVESLYEGISKGKVTSDDEAAKLLYGKKADGKSPTYVRIKNRLLRQLINTTFFVDVQQAMFNERAKAYYNCYRDFAAGMILIGREASTAGVYLLQQVLIQSQKYEFTELSTEVTRNLRKEYARSAVNQGSHEQMAQLHRQYEEKRRLEILSIDYYETLVNYYIAKRSPNDDIHQIASTYFEELSLLLTEADTSQFYYNWLQIGIIKYLSVNDCNSALKLSEDGLAHLLIRGNINRGALAAVAAQKLNCLTQLRIFDNRGEETASYCLSMAEYGSFNWFRINESYLHYCLFARRYEDALGIFTLISKHENYPTLSGAARDNWQLYGGYLHLLAALGKLDEAKVIEAVGEFRFAKLNNEIEVLAKDKQGMNIPLILLPVIFALVKGEFEDKEISPENLEKYRTRYLNIDMNRRSAAFLNLLLAYSKKDYNSASAERKIQKELEILANEQPQVTGQTFAVEIIPYEDLWEMMTEL